MQKVFFQLNLTQSDPSVLESYFREVITLLVNLPLAPSGDVSEKEQKGNKESSKDSVVVQVVADRDIDEKKHIGIHAGFSSPIHPRLIFFTSHLPFSAANMSHTAGRNYMRA